MVASVWNPSKSWPDPAVGLPAADSKAEAVELLEEVDTVTGRLTETVDVGLVVDPRELVLAP